MIIPDDAFDRKLEGIGEESVAEESLEESSAIYLLHPE